MTVPAHKGLVSALAASPKTDMVASGSHDQDVKLWKYQKLKQTKIVQIQVRFDKH